MNNNATAIPNALTAETLEKADRGEDLHEAEDAPDLFRKLGL
jgi:DNA-damage-inducible protein J